jgi:hypothetical protein
MNVAQLLSRYPELRNGEAVSIAWRRMLAYLLARI